MSGKHDRRCKHIEMYGNIDAMELWDPLVWDVENVSASMSGINQWWHNNRPERQYKVISNIRWRPGGAEGKVPGRLLIWRIA